MIPDKTLRYLVVQRIKDAEALLNNNRYPAAIYFAGYAVEVALKKKICVTFEFHLGFPETKQEFSNYLQFVNNDTRQSSEIDLRDIRIMT